MNETMNGYTIRKETESDYHEVENVTREAFWNVYNQGCLEHHYLHKMCSHKDFTPDLVYVLKKAGNIIGNVMYTKCVLKDKNGEVFDAKFPKKKEWKSIKEFYTYSHSSVMQ